MDLLNSKQCTRLWADKVCRVCGLIKCAGLWADILVRLTQIQTVGFAMLRLLCYVLHYSMAKPGACTCFLHICA